MQVLETFEIERGLIVAVAPASKLSVARRLNAVITRQDGSTVATTAYKEWLLNRDPSVQQDEKEAFLLLGVTKADVPIGSGITLNLAPNPLGKAYSAAFAEKYRALGWTLTHEFRADGDDEPYEYVFEWRLSGQPVRPN